MLENGVSPTAVGEKRKIERLLKPTLIAPKVRKTTQVNPAGPQSLNAWSTEESPSSSKDNLCFRVQNAQPARVVSTTRALPRVTAIPLSTTTAPGISTNS